MPRIQKGPNNQHTEKVINIPQLSSYILEVESYELLLGKEKTLNTVPTLRSESIKAQLRESLGFWPLEGYGEQIVILKLRT